MDSGGVHALLVLEDGLIGGWARRMGALDVYYALSFVLVKHSVCREPIFVLINVFTLLA